MKVLIYGDSLTKDLNLKQHESHIETYEGMMASEMLVMEEGGFGLSMCLKEEKYDAVILIAGTNDFSKGQTESEIITDMKKLQKACAKHVKQIIIMGIADKKFDNTKLLKLEDEQTKYCEFFEYIHESMLQEDKLHLNDFGKQLCVECLEDILSE